MSTEVTGVLLCLSSMATRAVLADLAAEHQVRTGRAVSLQAMGGVDAAGLVRAGGAADVVVLAAGVMEQLAGEGYLVAGSLVPVARSSMAVAIPEGVPRATVSSEREVQAALRAARCIAYSTGPSGDHLLRLVDRWGLTDMVGERLLRAPPGVPVAALLADGRADLGFQQTSEFVGQPGIVILGSLPAAIALDTVFSAGIACTSADPVAAASLVDTLASPIGAELKQARGLRQP